MNIGKNYILGTKISHTQHVVRSCRVVSDVIKLVPEGMQVGLSLVTNNLESRMSSSSIVSISKLKLS